VKKDQRTPVTNGLIDLRVESAAAGERYAVALRTLRAAGRGRVAYEAKVGFGKGDGLSEVGRGVFAELAAYRHSIETSRPDAIAESKRPQWERNMTEDIIAQIRERGLVFSPNADGWSVTLIDPTVEAAYDAARLESESADARLRAYEKDNADAMAAEVEAVTKGDFAQALQDGDVESVAGILRLTQEAQARREAADAALTTNDLPTGSPTRRHAAI
jgi:hypothetical protein